MDRRMIFTALACASTAAFAANTVNPTFLWDGATDTEGRVITGSPEETSGYWFSYDDANDHGTSHFQFPPEFDMNTYADPSFGPMVEAFGGIKATVVLGEGYEYPYVGFGFNIWNEDQESTDITAWGGICLEYSSELDFSVIVGIENEKTVIGYSGEEVAKRVSKSSSLTVVDLLWEKFNNPFALPIGKSENPAFAQAACIKLKFQEKAATTGDFFLKKIGSCHQAGRELPDERVGFGPHGELRESGAFCQGFRDGSPGPGREVRNCRRHHGLERPPGRHLHAPHRKP